MSSKSTAPENSESRGMCSKTARDTWRFIRTPQSSQQILQKKTYTIPNTRTQYTEQEDETVAYTKKKIRH